MSKLKNKAVAFLLGSVLIFSCVSELVVPALAEEMTPQEAETRVVDTYRAALERAELETFAGWCAKSVNNHLMVLGINTRYIPCNGNAEWESYAYRQMTSGGYPIRTYAATDYTLKKALRAAAQSDHTSNIMVCFQEGRTNKGKRYGHTFYIHTILDGMVYFAESFRTDWPFGTIEEGNLIKVSIEDLCSYYDICGFEGLVQFVDQNYAVTPKDLSLRSEQHPFTDIYEEWSVPGIEYVYQNGLFLGNSSTEFEPDASLSRAMFVQVLYNMEGKPAQQGAPCFTDTTDPSAWYYDALTWAAETKIIQGYEDGRFLPEAAVNREEYLSMLYRHSQTLPVENKKPEVAAEESATPDTEKTEELDWAAEAMHWADQYELLAGTKTEAGKPITRAQAADILMRYCCHVMAEDAEKTETPSNEQGL